MDLLTPEWEIFTTKPLPDPTEDFALRDDAGIPDALGMLFSDVVQVERLRQVRALVGFTRLDAPDPEDLDLVVRAPLTRLAKPEWVPASEVRGEGLFVRVREDLLSAWEARVHGGLEIEAHRQAFGRFRRNRYSNRVRGDFDEMRGWPGGRYIVLHTLSHLLIRAVALECGCAAASLSERIYAGTADNPRGGILIYTAVPDAEGTLGGLVSLGEPASLERIAWRALSDAQAFHRTRFAPSVSRIRRPTSSTALPAMSASSFRRRPASAATVSSIDGSLYRLATRSSRSCRTCDGQPRVRGPPGARDALADPAAAARRRRRRAIP